MIHAHIYHGDRTKQHEYECIIPLLYVEEIEVFVFVKWPKITTRQ